MVRQMCSWSAQQAYSFRSRNRKASARRKGELRILKELGKTAGYILLQCTWGVIQTCLGFALYVYYRRSPHTWYHGAVYTKWKQDGGISLGLFIFTPDQDEDWCRQMAVHEYGHTWQSLMLGPLYLIVIGIPSILWARLPYCIQLRREKKLPYSAFYPEQWADRLGAKMIKRW